MMHHKEQSFRKYSKGHLTMSYGERHDFQALMLYLITSRYAKLISFCTRLLYCEFCQSVECLLLCYVFYCKQIDHKNCFHYNYVICELDFKVTLKTEQEEMLIRKLLCLTKQGS